MPLRRYLSRLHARHAPSGSPNCPRAPPPPSPPRSLVPLPHAPTLLSRVPTPSSRGATDGPVTPRSPSCRPARPPAAPFALLPRRAPQQRHSAHASGCSAP
ncbi:hypothetical protein DENSPDRAFT_175830 [Dentipellis sp. KUC8613]|nr:hypothetical protein DENSPDRAFT_175830 [Dentipellis sp. KUC8613]